ncbi:MAG: hypothetical protein ACRC2A_11955 [Enterobacterales bacterium]|uniref:hypothetical protein n=1 Tax=Serratia sp. (in: enterobacteria) TaxID=616 RepID=UPI003F30FD77
MGKGKSVKKKAAKKQAPKNPRQQFNAHCQAIKQQHIRLDTLRRQQTELTTRFQQQLLPLEKQFSDTVYKKVERLLSFTDKKSLSASQKDVLIGWIGEEIMYLEGYPFAEHLDIETLREKYLVACAQGVKHDLDENEFQYLREALEKELPFIQQIPDEELLDLISDPKKLKARAAQEIADSTADEEEEFEENEFEDDEEAFIDEMEQEAIATREQRQREIASLFSTSVANRMYKQLAKIFHPDREMDDAAKQDKHHLMVQLAQAKQNNDIWSIISLYQQHIDPDGGVEEKDLPEINQLLAEQVISLKWDYRQKERECDPVTAVLWDKFGDAKTPQALDKKLNRHANDLKELLAEENEMLEELTSLKALKHHLNEREQEMEDELGFMADLFKLP